MNPLFGIEIANQLQKQRLRRAADERLAAAVVRSRSKRRFKLPQSWSGRIRRKQIAGTQASTTQLRSPSASTSWAWCTTDQRQ
jgi:hypothetical protein